MISALRIERNMQIAKDFDSTLLGNYPKHYCSIQVEYKQLVWAYQRFEELLTFLSNLRRILILIQLLNSRKPY